MKIRTFFLSKKTHLAFFFCLKIANDQLLKK